MPQSLGSTLRQIFSRNDRSQALAEIACATGEIAVLSRELLCSSMEGARQSTGQRTQTLDVVTMEERIRSLAERNAENSREAAARIESVARDAERGSEIMESTTLRLQQMEQAVTSSAAMMHQFVLRMSEVDSMVAAVGEIARQTNLLALNAAIEAANAGLDDNFSRIAQEIRLLADRTSKATNEIADRVKTMCSTAGDTEAAMLKGKLAVEESMQQTTATQHSFRGLCDVIRRVESMAAETAIASDRQIASVKRLTESVQKIDDFALGCTHEADTSAEISVRMTVCTVSFHEALARLNVPIARDAQYEQEAARELLGKMAAHEPQVDRAMNLLSARCAEAGPPALLSDTKGPNATPPNLRFGQIDAAEANSWLDSITEATSCVASIFVCTSGGKLEQKFLRVATTFRRSDGSRALGTMLNPKGMASRKLLARQSHRGAAYVLGKPLLSIYEPLLSASGELIGSLYVGYSLD